MAALVPPDGGRCRTRIGLPAAAVPLLTRGSLPAAAVPLLTRGSLPGAAGRY